MRTLFIPQGSSATQFHLVDPSDLSETEFEAYTVQTLSSAYPEHRCVILNGRFKNDGEYKKADLALVANDSSHWFVIEVELVHHSFDRHVVPQVKAFRYGTPQPDVLISLARSLCISEQAAETLLTRVPREVAVIVNALDEDWPRGLRTINVQHAVINVYRSPDGAIATEFVGDLAATKEHLGFGKYSAVDDLVLMRSAAKLVDGHMQIEMPTGSLTEWHIFRDHGGIWLQKVKGRADLPDGAVVQLIRTDGTRVSLRLSR